MKKEVSISLEFIGDKNSLIDFYSKSDISIKNELFDYFLSTETINSFGSIIDEFLIELKLNLNKNKSILLFKSLISLIDYLSKNFPENYMILTVSYPIFRTVPNMTIKKKYRKENMEHPIDFVDEKFIFKNGYLKNNLKNNSSALIPNKNFFFTLFKNTINYLNSLDGEVFYSISYPEKIEGFDIIEISDDIYKYKKIIV
jgi:hypothetical protein